MNFYIDKLLLWLKDGSLETLQFENDKVNIITGNSKTGKTAILEIIDYCFCGGRDTVTISHEHIGENVAWYGIRFHVNDKLYTIARGEISEGVFSKEYYFSQTGEIPEKPFEKLGEDELKRILEPEFAIDNEVTLSYGGRGIKRNSKLSFRFFLMFNTLSKDVIDNSKFFFDKLNIDRYRDVWPQLFDLAFKVIDPETVSTQNTIVDLQQELYQLEQNKKRAEKHESLRDEQIAKVVKRAKEAGLVDESVSIDEAFSELLLLTTDQASRLITNFSEEQESERLLEKRDNISLQLAKLRRFKRSYNDYRNRLSLEEDALKPITYIQASFTDKTSGEYYQFLNSLAVELARIKQAISKARPFEQDVEKKIQELNLQLREIDRKLDQTAQVKYHTISTANKLISLGEIKAEIGHISPKEDSLSSIESRIQAVTSEIDEKKAVLGSVSEKRALIIESLNDYIKTYMNVAKGALDEYGDYSPWFDYKKASLLLRKKQSSMFANISSSSDHLFMHLCLFAGLHHMLLAQESVYVPSFLILDQPSRPYFNTDVDYNYEDSEKLITNKDDWSKVKDIFKLWDRFFDYILSKNMHFQVIMLEHVSEKAWQDCTHTHLVSVFDGLKKALIPVNYSNKA